MIFDRICAVASPIGVSAIGMIRCSGEGVHSVVMPFLKGIRGIESRLAKRAEFVCGNRTIDEVVAVFFSKPSSYTGEDMVEITFHGSPLILQNALQCLMSKGMRLALPGEFTKRAVLNGKMDLIKAESINAMISAPTSRALEAAMSAFKGGLSVGIEKLRRKLIGVLAEIEVELNYPEEHLSDRKSLRKELASISFQLSDMVSRGQNGIVLTQGIKTVIVGRPNVGKSTLLNTLLRKDRAIVTDIPGTTRDTIEEALNVGGTYFRIIDTAGIRMDADGIEYLGVKRSLNVIGEADLCLFVIDLSDPEEDLHLLEQLSESMKRYIVVGNKKDLEKDESQFSGCDVKISARSGNGLEELEKTMKEKTWEITELGNDEVIVSERQKSLLVECIDILNDAVVSLDRNEGIDIASSLLSQSLLSLDELTGRRATEDLLDSIFSNFCVGK